MVKMTKTSALIVFLLLAVSSCIEEDVKPQLIKGRLIESCRNPVPVANRALTLEVLTGTFLYSVEAHRTVTDEDGNFQFSFDSEDWQNRRNRGPYYGEIIDDDSGYGILEGIKPSNHEVGDVVLDVENYQRSTYLVLTFDTDQLDEKDSLVVEKYYRYTKTGAVVFDTIGVDIRGLDQEGNYYYGPPINEDRNIRITWDLYNSGEHVRRGNTHFPVSTICDTLPTRELIVKWNR